MTWPDIMSGKIIYQYAKIILFILEHKLLLSYDNTFFPRSIFFYDFY